MNAEHLLRTVNGRRKAKGVMADTGGEAGEVGGGGAGGHTLRVESSPFLG